MANDPPRLRLVDTVLLLLVSGIFLSQDGVHLVPEWVLFPIGVVAILTLLLTSGVLFFKVARSVVLGVPSGQK